MRKVDLKDYLVSVINNGKEVEIPIQMKRWIKIILFHPQLKLTAMQLIDNSKLLEKIENSKDDILLEENEYQKLLNIINTIQGYSLPDLQAITKIKEAKVIEIEEKKI